MMDKHPNGLPEAEGIIGEEATSNPGHPSFIPLSQTMVSKAIEVHYPQHLQCHPSWTAWTHRDALDEGGGIKKKCI